MIDGVLIFFYPKFIRHYYFVDAPLNDLLKNNVFFVDYRGSMDFRLTENCYFAGPYISPSKFLARLVFKTNALRHGPSVTTIGSFNILF